MCCNAVSRPVRAGSPSTYAIFVMYCIAQIVACMQCSCAYCAYCATNYSAESFGLSCALCVRCIRYDCVKYVACTTDKYTANTLALVIFLLIPTITTIHFAPKEAPASASAAVLVSSLQQGKNNLHKYQFNIHFDFQTRYTQRDAVCDVMHTKHTSSPRAAPPPCPGRAFRWGPVRTHFRELNHLWKSTMCAAAAHDAAHALLPLLLLLTHTTQRTKFYARRACKHANTRAHGKRQPLQPATRRCVVCDVDRIFKVLYEDCFTQKRRAEHTTFTFNDIACGSIKSPPPTAKKNEAL